MIYVVSVSGWRKHADAELIYGTLDRVGLSTAFRFDLFVRVGDAKGADEIVRQWRSERGVPGLTYEAGWDRHGKAAGMIRNQEMLRGTKDPHGLSHLLLAFPEPGKRKPHSGTWGCIDEAFDLGVRVEIPPQGRRGA